MKSTSRKIGIILGLLSAIYILSFSGCAKIGYDFNSQHVQKISIGATTQNDIVSMFGQPWRKGIDNGVTMWTYGHYTYRIIGDADTKDLIVKFNNKGIVSSYTFNKSTDRK